MSTALDVPRSDRARGDFTGPNRGSLLGTVRLTAIKSFPGAVLAVLLASAAGCTGTLVVTQRGGGTSDPVAAARAGDGLPVLCKIVDEGGKVRAAAQSSGHGWCEVSAPSLSSGTYFVEAQSQCQPDLRVPVGVHETNNKRVAEQFELPAPPPRNVFAAKDVVMDEYYSNTALGRGDKHATLPPNTEVQIIRSWPDARGGCDDIIVVVINAAEAVPRGSVWIGPGTAFQAEPLSTGTVDQVAAARRQEAERNRSGPEKAGSFRSLASS